MDCTTPGFPVLHYLPGACSNSCLLRWSCYLTISSSVTPFSFCLQSFPASGSFSVNQLFASGGQSIWVSVSEISHPMNIEGWFPLGLTGLISLESKGLRRVFSSTVRKHQFFGIQPSLYTYVHTVYCRCTCRCTHCLFRVDHQQGPAV